MISKSIYSLLRVFPYFFIQPGSHVSSTLSYLSVSWLDPTSQISARVNPSTTFSALTPGLLEKISHDLIDYHEYNLMAFDIQLGLTATRVPSVSTLNSLSFLVLAFSNSLHSPQIPMASLPSLL